MMESETGSRIVGKYAAVENSGNQLKRPRISYDLTKSFTHALISGTVEETEKITQINQGLNFEGEVHIVSQM